MKIQSPLSNQIKILSLLLTVPLLAAIIFCLSDKRVRHPLTSYHQSIWNEYAPDIERSLKVSSNIDAAGIDHVYGGVVSHHIPTTIPKLVEFYSRLKKTQNVKNFIVIGPDHTNAGNAPITISNESFFTAFGEVKPIDGFAEILQASHLVNIEEPLFDNEHSIGSQILVISKIFPDAHVTPIVLRSNTTKEQAIELGKILATHIDNDTVLIASVDFSHYLPTSRAIPLDQISGEVIRNLDLSALPLIKADSSKSMLVFMQAMSEKHATETSNFEILNTNDLMQNSDYTTGYVFGFWGTGKKANPSASEAPSTTLLFVGDVMLSRKIGKLMVENNNWSYPFMNIADFLKSADLTFANLEGPISNNGIKVGSIYSFRADPHVVEGLLYAGIDVVSVANNHIWDYGKEAFKDTLSLLKSVNISPVGGGLTYAEAHTPVIKEVHGIKIAYLGYTNLLPQSLSLPGDKLTVAAPNEEEMIDDIQNAKKQADVVVASFHWGEEYKTQHNAFQEHLAHAAIDAGATLVIGHHPHVVEEVEKYKEGYIAYSLGNFVFDQNFSEDTRYGLTLLVTLKGAKIENVTTQKVNFNETYQPFLVGP